MKKQTVLFLLSLLTLTSLSAQRIPGFGPPPPPELQLSGTIKGYHSNPSRITIKNGRIIPESRLEIKQTVNPGGEDIPGEPGFPGEVDDCRFGQKPSTWILDSDGDGYGTDSDVKLQCSRPQGYVKINVEGTDNIPFFISQTLNPKQFCRIIRDFNNQETTICHDIKPPNPFIDCNDQDASINPGTLWYHDEDEDGYGNPNSSIKQCMKPSGYLNNTSGDYVTNNYDCDDTDWKIGRAPLKYKDADKDGFGDPNSPSRQCSYSPQDYVDNNNDCNDSDPAINPYTLWYRDTDGDGYGAPDAGGDGYNSLMNLAGKMQCIQPEGYIRHGLNADALFFYFHTLYQQKLERNKVCTYGPDPRYIDPPSTTEPVETCYYTEPQKYPSGIEPLLFKPLKPLDCNDNDPKINPDMLWYLQKQQCVRHNGTERVFKPQTCNEDVSLITSQEVSDTYTSEQCFLFDNAGNQTSSDTCPSTTARTARLETKDDQEDGIASKIEIYPVPAENFLNIRWTAEVDHLVSNIVFSDMSGRLSLPLTKPANAFHLRINVSGYADGIYIVSFFLKDGRRINKYIAKY